MAQSAQYELWRERRRQVAGPLVTGLELIEVALEGRAQRGSVRELGGGIRAATAIPVLHRPTPVEFAPDVPVAGAS